MREIRGFLINVLSALGLASLFIMLAVASGYQIGILKPPHIVTWFAHWANNINSSPLTWSFITLCVWIFAVWATWIIFKFRNDPPLVIIEDEFGAVEITTDALASLAKAEILAQSGSKPYRAEFARKQGGPVLQVWCDLMRSGSNGGPVEWGEKLKGDIERRLREDFCLDKIRVEIIHQPPKNHRANGKQLSVA